MSGYLWRGKPDLETINALIMAMRSGRQPDNVGEFEWRTSVTRSVSNGGRQHGTYAGYQQHMRSDRQPCENCRLAEREYGNAMRRKKRQAAA